MNSSAEASSATQRLPDYFPGSIKACQEPAEKLFTCFTTNAVKKDDNDTLAGAAGLTACTKELSSYQSCMEKHLTRIEAKKFRVQEEYRNKV